MHRPQRRAFSEIWSKRFKMKWQRIKTWRYVITCGEIALSSHNIRLFRRICKSSRKRRRNWSIRMPSRKPEPNTWVGLGWSQSSFISLKFRFFQQLVEKETLKSTEVLKKQLGELHERIRKVRISCCYFLQHATFPVFRRLKKQRRAKWASK